ncbi:MAG: hypothetical protein ACD_63C00171G0004 [uncultured bacterium]|nr:MAG: hypothetical protein ACD_63C00171G0004 [uncultured bacterium]KKT02907.1 MAG: hypothetical protein UV80_C0001G0009 [Candidatus Peregrinibacteria bacterium GW2011_GWF2_43_17]KKT20394.1 MAG: hypothetical protein UW03_C0005G0029 [Candidatus Peregrinibacteria bacterium GW2011_GWA2_43_8]HAU40252.1 hypothetical protein [Candidatus Peregrinibacteria bacterium]
MKKNLLLLVTFLLLATLWSKGCSEPVDTTSVLTQGDIGISTQKGSYTYGKEVRIYIQNNTSAEIIIKNECPSEYLDVFGKEGEAFTQITASHEIDCSAYTDITLAPKEKKSLSYSYWTYSLFSEIGTYQIRYTDPTTGTTYYSNEFAIEEPSATTKFWREVFFKPIYNGLIFVIKNVPGHYLALGIILITLLIRTILLIPSQHAIRSQKRMQDLQPKLEEIKQKYAGNQEKIAMETMRVWQENKVNPFGSCLPILIQFPILIALFYTIKDGLNPDKVIFLYDFQKDFLLSNINTKFLAFDLTKNDLYVFPILVGLLQFTQMKLSLARKKNKKEPAKKENSVTGDIEQANKMMIYFMPLMIAFFTASVPAGVGLYWGVSTSYGIIQQIIVNREGKDKKEPTVKVIEKS